MAEGNGVDRVGSSQGIADAGIETAALRYQAAIHGELYSASTRAERDRMLAAALLSLGVVFLGLTAPELSMGPAKLGIGRPWTLPLGLLLMVAYFTGSFIIGGILDRKIWFANGAPTALEVSRLAIPAMNHALAEQQAYGFALNDVTQRLSEANAADSAARAAAAQKLADISERAGRREFYDVAELDTAKDASVRALEHEHQRLRTDYELAYARFGIEWPPERLSRMEVAVPVITSWKRPYLLQLGWFFLLPLLISLLAMMALVPVIFASTSA